MRGPGWRQRAQEKLQWGRKARAEVGAYANCTENQAMAMFGWTDPKIPAHDIVQANQERFGISDRKEIVAFDPCQSRHDLLQLAEAGSMRTPGGNRIVTFPTDFRRKPQELERKIWLLVRSEGGRICCDINGLPRSFKE